MICLELSLDENLAWVSGHKNENIFGLVDTN